VSIQEIKEYFMRRIGIVCLMVLLAFSLVLVGCSKEETPEQTGAAPQESESVGTVEQAPETQETEPQGSDSDEKFKAAFIYIGPPGDLGWTYMHDVGRLEILEELGDQVETTYIESVEEGPDSARIMSQYARQGYDMIFATSFGYMDFMYETAADYPDTLFEHCSGYMTAENMSTYFGRMYQPRYLSGIVAGEMTETDVIGYVAAFPIPEVIRGLNAFTLGAQFANPDVEVRVIWTNTWYDPVKEREAAIALLDAGADILAQHQDTTEPPKAAKERGAYSIGYDADMRKFVGDTVLVSPVWNWGPYYTETIQAAIDGTWETHEFWGGLKEGTVKLSEFSPFVPEDVRSDVDDMRKMIESGTWDVFTGPIYDQDGKLVVKDGEKMSDGDMLSMSFLVDGVIGSIN
jgi:basic membrane protein A